jgi:hypothetical protein
VDLNRIGLVQMKLGWTWPIWPIGPVHRPTSPGSTTPGSPLASLPHPTNPNPNRSPRSRDSESPAALPHDSGEPRCRLPTPRRAIGPPPWPPSSHRGKSPPSTSLAPAESLSPPPWRDVLGCGCNLPALALWWPDAGTRPRQVLQVRRHAGWRRRAPALLCRGAVGSGLLLGRRQVPFPLLF